MRMEKSQKADTTKSWENREQEEISLIAEWIQNGTATLEDILVVSDKIKHSYQLTQQSHSVFTQKSWKFMFTQNPHRDVYKSFVHSCPNLEATMLSFCR
jgi:hypothetical protein